MSPRILWHSPGKLFVMFCRHLVCEFIFTLIVLRFIAQATWVMVCIKCCFRCSSLLAKLYYFCCRCWTFASVRFIPTPVDCCFGSFVCSLWFFFGFSVRPAECCNLRLHNHGRHYCHRLLCLRSICKSTVHCLLCNGTLCEVFAPLVNALVPLPLHHIPDVPYLILTAPGYDITCCCTWYYHLVI